MAEWGLEWGVPVYVYCLLLGQDLLGLNARLISTGLHVAGQALRMRMHVCTVCRDWVRTGYQSQPVIHSVHQLKQGTRQPVHKPQEWDSKETVSASVARQHEKKPQKSDS